MASIVASSRAPEVERVRDDAWDALYEDTTSTIGVKSRVSAGDQEKITELTYQAVLRASDSQPGVQQMETTFALHRASLATAAVMITDFDGPLFEDPDTGRTLAIAGSLDARLDVVRRLPQVIINFVDTKIAEMNRAPNSTVEAESA